MQTKIKPNYILTLFLLGVMLLTSCTKEESLFKGKDNYVSSFSLKQGNSVFNAVISDNVITVKVPEGFSLDGASATILLSENAQIYPDPATITEWNSEILFAVTAYDGTQTRYKYTIARTNIENGETVLLETQADVDAFGAKGITSIEGNLVIGRVAGTDSITSLAPLSQLKEITYSLIINRTYSGSTLTGLEKLESVGGEIRMDGLPNLETVSLPSLKRAGDVYIKNTLVGKADLPLLTSVNKALTLDSPLGEVRFPNLKTVGGKITFNTTSNSNAMMTRITFPSLEEAGGVVFSYFKNTTKVELPELKTVGDMSFTQLTLLSVIIAPKLEKSTGIITIPSTAYLTEVSFPSLVEAYSFIVDSKVIRVIELSKLKTVADRLTLRSVLINGIADFRSLERVDGELLMYELTKMTSFEFPATLKYIKKLSIDIRNAPLPSEIDVRNVNLGELKVMANAIRAKIIGDDLFQGTLTISSGNATYNNGYPSFPELQGFHEVDSLSLDGYVSAMDTAHIRGIKKINKSFRVENNNMKRFSMPDLEEIGGNFYFARLDQSPDQILEFTRLKKIGGDFDLSVGSQKIRTLSFPMLETVGGNFKLGTGYRADRSLETLQFPALHTIGGAMLLHGYSGSNANLLLKNLDGFTSLRSVRSIEITYQKAIESFEGLKEAFRSLEPSGWKATDNNYNPTYEELKNGLWTKP